MQTEKAASPFPSALSDTYNLSRTLLQPTVCYCFCRQQLSLVPTCDSPSAGSKLPQALAPTLAMETGSGHQTAKRHKSATPKAEAPSGTGNASPTWAAVCFGISCCLPLQYLKACH